VAASYGPVLKPYYIKMENPYEMSMEELLAVKPPGEVMAKREELKAQG
jgi:hypothetical protein